MKPTIIPWTIWSSALLFSSPAAAFLPPIRPRQSESFDWSAITPTHDLQYHDCFTMFKCARLLVPLDWSKHTRSVPGRYTNSSSEAHAAIAIVTLPAAVPVTDPSYGGPILLNPGGPGGSGTDMALAYGPSIQMLTDTPGVRHFDIIGFDPRGVGKSTPSAMCFENEFERSLHALQYERMPDVTTELGVNMKFAVAEATQKLCAERTAGQEGGSIFLHMSTASVARDMLEIVERAEEARSKAPGMKRAAETPRLQYLGFSYGSHLGNTFASMFPGRVGRMVVDGIVDAEDYTAGAWLKNLNDIEEAVDNFYRTCFDAGEACPLRQPQDRNGADLRRRVDALIQSLDEAPISVPRNGRVNVLTSFIVREFIRVNLYDPITTYEQLARVLANLLAENYEDFFGGNSQSSLCAEVDETSPPQRYTWGNEATPGVLCGDSYAAAGQRNLSWARDLSSRLVQQSPTAGAPWARIPMSCANWEFAPPYAFHGPWGSPAPDPRASNSTPAAPLLILSTRVDNATPLANAWALSQVHKGSSVVVQEGYGHCALLASESECTIGIVREYFNTGRVPNNGTVCETDCKPQIPHNECRSLRPSVE
ncbi:hypothetical protein MFIFM68171_05662 [Madurella fahalii]|uniref:Uncharacterized protein n=1 Tax=Madurella fahalii TaxID=1157608 RepID=A0ABQ0GCG7_9PEZI